MYEVVIVSLGHILQSCANMQGNYYLRICTCVLLTLNQTKSLDITYVHLHITVMSASLHI